MSITTVFEIRDNSLVATRPGEVNRIVLIQEMDPKDDEKMDPSTIMRAVRNAYSMGRADQRAETGAMLRGVLGL